MKISVIVPVYNCEKYLSACVESILGQTFSSLEIILVDDGSSDGSPRICDMYASADPRIRVIHQRNHGVSAARNAGLKLAVGELVSFIDSDDTLEADMYEMLVSYMNQYNADISHCGFNRVEDSIIRPIYGTGKIAIHDSVNALECLIAGRLFSGGLWNKLYKKELLEGLTFREDLKINEDILFNFEAFRRATKIIFADYAKYNYFVRQNASACFTTSDEKKLKDSLSVNAYMYSQLAGSDLADIAAERYLRCLSGYYRYCFANKKSDCKSIAAAVRDVAGRAKSLSRNMKITSKMIHFCPRLYCFVYTVYRRIHEPNWEV